MLELKITCENAEEARVYLNTHQYLGLLTDFTEAIRSATKHGTEKDVLHQVTVFYREMCSACDNHTGAY